MKKGNVFFTTAVPAPSAELPLKSPTTTEVGIAAASGDGRFSDARIGGPVGGIGLLLGGTNLIGARKRFELLLITISADCTDEGYYMFMTNCR